jgi:diphthine-ammonia ligase
MVDAGLEAILIKVAGVGLHTKHLGKTLAQMQPTLLKLVSHISVDRLFYLQTRRRRMTCMAHIYAVRVESMKPLLSIAHFSSVVSICKSAKLSPNQSSHDSPREETEIVIHSDNDFASVAYLRIKRATLQEKEKLDLQPAVPLLLEEKYQDIQEKIENILSKQQVAAYSVPHYAPKDAILYFLHSSRRVGPWVTVTAIGRSSSAENLTLEDEIHACFQSLQGPLIYNSHY